MCYVYCFHGTGAGKTTNALGLALRSLGHDHKVLVVQFLKWWKNTGEYLFEHPNYRIKQFGRKNWIGLSNLNERDKELSRRGLEYAVEESKKYNPNLIILDEINLALHCKMLDIDETLEAINKMSKHATIVLTGRCPPREILIRSDFINEIIDIKSPREEVAEEGIQY